MSMTTKIITGIAAVLVIACVSCYIIVSCLPTRVKEQPEVVEEQPETDSEPSLRTTVSKSKPVAEEERETPDGETPDDVSKRESEGNQSVDAQDTEDIAVTKEEEYTEPAEHEEPAKKLSQKILEAYRNADLKAILAISKGKMREILEKEYEPPSAEEAALAQEIEISDSWYVGDDEFHFVLSLRGYNIEYILQQDETGWWLVDGIPDVVEVHKKVTSQDFIDTPE